MRCNLSPRAFILQMLLFASACTTEETITNQRLIIGIVSYEQQKQTTTNPDMAIANCL